MGELRVRTDGHHVAAQLEKLLVPLGERRKLRCADKSKIRRIKNQNRPAAFPDLLVQGELAKVASRRLVGGHFEVRHLLSQLQMNFLYLLHVFPPLLLCVYVVIGSIPDYAAREDVSNILLLWTG